MNTANILPITEAREKIGKLVDEVRKTYKKTYIDPKLLKYTREFTDEEIEEWLKEDTLLTPKKLHDLLRTP